MMDSTRTFHIIHPASRSCLDSCFTSKTFLEEPTKSQPPLYELRRQTKFLRRPNSTWGAGTTTMKQHAMFLKEKGLSSNNVVGILSPTFAWQKKGPINTLVYGIQYFQVQSNSHFHRSWRSKRRRHGTQVTQHFQPESLNQLVFNHLQFYFQDWDRDSNQCKPFFRKQVESNHKALNPDWWRHCLGIQNLAFLAREEHQRQSCYIRNCNERSNFVYEKESRMDRFSRNRNRSWNPEGDRSRSERKDSQRKQQPSSIQFNQLNDTWGKYPSGTIVTNGLDPEIHQQ